jgi:hypothetical protein
MSVSLAKPEQAPRVKPHATVACHTLDDVHNELKRQTLAVKRAELLAAVEPTYLSVTWGISKARDSYGYSRVQVQDVETSKRFSACGGGYDMLGDCFGQWLQSTHQTLLLAYSDLAHDISVQYEQGKPWQRTENPQGLCGMTLNTRQGVQDISLDGGCGLDCMIRIARAIGLSVDAIKTYNRRGQCSGVAGYRIAGGVK